MVQNANSRQIQFYDARVSSIYRERTKQGFTHPVKSEELSKLMRHVKLFCQKTDGAPKFYRNETMTIYLSDIIWDNGNQTVTFLVNCSDREAADGVVSDPKVGYWRRVEKKGEEGNDYSAHVIFSLVPTETGVYHCAIEKAPRLGNTVLSRYFRYLVTSCTRHYKNKFMRRHPDGSLEKSGKEKQLLVWSYIQFYAHPSDAILDEIENGKVKALELIDTSNISQPVDSEQYAVVKKNVLEIDLNPLKPIKHRFPVLRAIMKDQKSHYDQLRIKLETPDSGRTLTFNTNTQDFTSPDERFIQTKRIFSDVKLPESFDKIATSIESEMKKYLLKLR